MDWRLSVQLWLIAGFILLAMDSGWSLLMMVAAMVELVWETTHQRRMEQARRRMEQARRSRRSAFGR